VAVKSGLRQKGLFWDINRFRISVQRYNLKNYQNEVISFFNLARISYLLTMTIVELAGYP
jgi:hypothetical protein